MDQHGQVIDVLVPARRDLAAARRFFNRAMRAGPIPVEVMTGRARFYPRVPDELVPSALHVVERHANNPVETDHRRLKARLRPIRGPKRHRSAPILAAGHAFTQNLRRGHYQITTDTADQDRLRIAFHSLAVTIGPAEHADHSATLADRHSDRRQDVRWSVCSGHRRIAHGTGYNDWRIRRKQQV